MSKWDKVRKNIDDATEKALDMVGVFVEGEAVIRCPVDTGNLRGSITHKVRENKVVVGTNVEYAPYVEFGTYKAKAQPYLRPAVDKNRSKIKTLFNEVYKKALKI